MFPPRRALLFSKPNGASQTLRGERGHYLCSLSYERGSYAVLGTLIDRFLPVVRSLPARIELTGEVAEALTLDQEGPIRVVWVPFEYVPPRPVLALVGITPGRYQGEQALTAFREGLRLNLSIGDALRYVEATASFSGPMRANLVAMLDHIGVHDALRIASCAALFGSVEEPVHFTSAMRYPVFVNGINYSGSPDIIRTGILRRWVETTLAEEARLLPNVLWVPLGPRPAMALHRLAAQGLIDRNRILDGLPHPSGANAERIAFFLGRKSRDALSRVTRADGIEAALARLRNQVRRLTT